MAQILRKFAAPSTSESCWTPNLYTAHQEMGEMFYCCCYAPKETALQFAVSSAEVLATEAALEIYSWFDPAFAEVSGEICIKSYIKS